MSNIFLEQRTRVKKHMEGAHSGRRLRDERKCGSAMCRSGQNSSSCFAKEFCDGSFKTRVTKGYTFLPAVGESLVFMKYHRRCVRSRAEGRGHPTGLDLGKKIMQTRRNIHSGVLADTAADSPKSSPPLHCCFQRPLPACRRAVALGG